MTAKAEQLGSSRFIAVAEDGKRTPLQKIGSEWQREPQRPALPERSLDPPAPSATRCPRPPRWWSRCPASASRSRRPNPAMPRPWPESMHRPSAPPSSPASKPR